MAYNVSTSNRGLMFCCPLCSNNLSYFLLHKDNDGNQQVWWTCSRFNAETVSCTFPIGYPDDVYWIWRSASEVERQVVPGPKLHLLPKKYHHLYPSLFRVHSKNGVKIMYPPKQQHIHEILDSNFTSIGRENTVEKSPPQKDSLLPEKASLVEADQEIDLPPSTSHDEIAVQANVETNCELKTTARSSRKCGRYASPEKQPANSSSPMKNNIDTVKPARSCQNSDKIPPVQKQSPRQFVDLKATYANTRRSTKMYIAKVKQEFAQRKQRLAERAENLAKIERENQRAKTALDFKSAEFERQTLEEIDKAVNDKLLEISSRRAVAASTPTPAIKIEPSYEMHDFMEESANIALNSENDDWVQQEFDQSQYEFSEWHAFTSQPASSYDLERSYDGPL